MPVILNPKLKTGGHFIMDADLKFVDSAYRFHFIFYIRFMCTIQSDTH